MILCTLYALLYDSKLLYHDIQIKSSKYYDAVTALSKAGIVNGYGDEFRPNVTLTRAQLAKMLTIGFELQQSTQTNTKFMDVNKLTDEATKQYIQTLVDYGITKEFLIEQNNLAHNAITTPNCREKCANCGATCFKGGVCYEKR